jgi:periplasmic divalent cation tolerance protein
MGSNTTIRILYVPCGSEDEARGLAVSLIERGLIACANIYSSRSIYRWKGETADEVEHVLFAKTTAALAQQAATAAEELHSYDIPCAMVLEPASVNAPYEAWVMGEVGTPAAQEITG